MIRDEMREQYTAGEGGWNPCVHVILAGGTRNSSRLQGEVTVSINRGPPNRQCVFQKVLNANTGGTAKIGKAVFLMG